MSRQTRDVQLQVVSDLHTAKLYFERAATLRRALYPTWTQAVDTCKKSVWREDLGRLVGRTSVVEPNAVSSTAAEDSRSAVMEEASEKGPDKGLAKGCVR